MKVAFVTAPPAEANGLASRAVETKVATCVNVLSGVTSHYVWRGEIQTDGESLLIAKIPEDKTEEFVERIREWHSYECPEVILLDIVGGNPEYIAWVEDPDSASGT